MAYLLQNDRAGLPEAMRLLFRPQPERMRPMKKIHRVMNQT
jgi:hypothetical protein